MPFDKLLEEVAYGECDEETVASLASRLARLQHKHDAPTDEAADRRRDTDGWQRCRDLIHPLLAALESKSTAGRAAGGDRSLSRTNPNLRQTLLTIQQRARDRRRQRQRGQREGGRL